MVLIHMADEARNLWPELAIKFWCLRAPVRGRFRLKLFPIQRGCVKEIGCVLLVMGPMYFAVVWQLVFPSLSPFFHEGHLCIDAKLCCDKLWSEQPL